ncbi:expressed unknown protein [Ectocarpus siliculosus]|uniref:Uncharacterized protein n=1 Tax=Ectocarpus siliculosus TaxID=2880 RepID=D8LSD8_ECTSI|nr:expressed unknown protein [Ectocarpus siliculosus]|eukprot:CBN75195.1 expressed unknown protein [Ectocarpus siliculosus]
MPRCFRSTPRAEGDRSGVDLTSALSSLCVHTN